MGNSRSNRWTLNLGSPPSVPRRFQRYLGWFWGRNASLVRGESRGSGFVLYFQLVKLDIACKRLWTWTVSLETWLGTCFYTISQSIINLSFSDFENPPSFLLVVD